MKDAVIKIGNKLIGKGRPVFIIAEAGINHNGKVGFAKKLIDAASSTGADAVKFQTFKTEKIMDSSAPLWDAGKKTEFSYDTFRDLKKYCDQKKIIFLSTPHSCKEDIDLVSELASAIKVGSGDLTNLPTLRYIAQKRLPVILSTGMGNIEEIREALGVLDRKRIIVLHCTTNYPTSKEKVNLLAIKTLREDSGVLTGYSDHTMGIKAVVAAAALEAVMVEKHLTLDKNLPGPDHKASLEPREFKAMVLGIRDVERRLKNGEEPEKIISSLGVKKELGTGKKVPFPSELEIAKFVRKSVVAERDIAEGEIIDSKVLAIKRPGTGILPKYLEEVIGRRVRKDIAKNSPLQWEWLD